MDKELPTWAILGMGAAILGGIYIAIRASQAKARAAASSETPDYDFTMGPVQVLKSGGEGEQYVQAQLLLASTAADQGACLAANDAVLNAVRAMESLSNPALLRADARLRDTLVRRYSDPEGLCI